MPRRDNLILLQEMQQLEYSFKEKMHRNVTESKHFIRRCLYKKEHYFPFKNAIAICFLLPKLLYYGQVMLY